MWAVQGSLRALSESSAALPSRGLFHQVIWSRSFCTSPSTTVLTYAHKAIHKQSAAKYKFARSRSGNHLHRNLCKSGSPVAASFSDDTAPKHSSRTDDENETDRRKRYLAIVFDSLRTNLPNVLVDTDPDYDLYSEAMEFEETISGSHISCKTLSQYMMVLRGFRLSAHCVLKDPTIEMLNIRKIPERMEIQVRWRLKSEACALRTMLSMGPDCDAVLDANSVFRVSEDGYVCFHRCEKVQRRFDPEDDAPNILQRMGRKLSGRGATPCPAYSKHDG